MSVDAQTRRWLRSSLVFVWLATACVSILERDGQSQALLRDAGLRDATLIATLIWGGAMVDAALGLLMWFKPGRRVYLLALAVMAGMTLLATVLNAGLWLHPLGPLAKNVPLAVALVMLARRPT